MALTGRPDAANTVLQDLVAKEPTCADAYSALAQLTLSQGDAAKALHYLELAARLNPDSDLVRIDMAQLLAELGHSSRALEVLEEILKVDPQAHDAWLVLARVLDTTGASTKALLARYEAVTRAQQQGRWTSKESTPPHLMQEVLHAIDAVRAGRKTLMLGCVSDLREQHGALALERFDRAVLAYTGTIEMPPKHARQRPRFLYFPELPDSPYLDSRLHPWAARLQTAWVAIKQEANALLAGEQSFPSFIDFKPADKVERFLKSTGRPPSWEAFFFYRHGQRYDENHRRCPHTSQILDNLDLCRIPHQAPEVCFSILRAGSHILPHHGVTNTRAVLHLPLIIPSDCALNLVDVGAHHWREGELVLFDDTYLHEAWNRSGSPRVVLLMDCWNPHLTLIEREAVIRLTTLVDNLRRASEHVPQ
jgi:aspartate beta-hydroxylase